MFICKMELRSELRESYAESWMCGINSKALQGAKLRLQNMSALPGTGLELPDAIGTPTVP